MKGELAEGVMWLLLLALLTSDKWQVKNYRWHKTCGTWHMTHENWHMTHDPWQMTCDKQIHYYNFFFYFSIFGYFVLLLAQSSWFSVSPVRICHWITPWMIQSISCSVCISNLYLQGFYMMYYFLLTKVESPFDQLQKYAFGKNYEIYWSQNLQFLGSLWTILLRIVGE